MEYEDFVVQLSTSAEKRYEVRVVQSPGGQARSHFDLPFDPAELSMLRAWSGPADERQLVRPVSPLLLTPEQIGERLFNSLFTGQVRRRFDYSLGRVEEAGRGLRVQLKIDLPELSRLHALPWELLYRGEVQEFLSLSDRTLVARYLDVPQPERPWLRPRPLRILAVLSDLASAGYPALDLERERRYLEETARQDGVELVLLEDARREALAEALAKERFHILHFSGHGWFDETTGEGGLCFKAPDGSADRVSGKALATELGTFRDLQLIFLNACSTATVAPESTGSPFLGAAAALVLAGFPAVVAMRVPISDAAAIAFSRAFYGRLLAGDPLETSLLQGRLAISRLDPGSAEWSTPILFLRSHKSKEVALERVPSVSLAPRPVLRSVFDRVLPSFHRALTRRGIFPEPQELPALDTYLRNWRAKLEQEIGEKIYLPLEARTVPGMGLGDDQPLSPFVRPVHLAIRQVLGREEGGDSASAQIAAVNRRSRLVHSVVRVLLSSSDPIVLLGDPGSGKTMTLQETALALVCREEHQVFPTVPLYVRLGEFHVAGKVGPEEVLEFVKRSAPPTLRPWIDDLDREGRLIILFDGMDEMSRDRYNEHIEALSEFAGQRKGRTRTLFSCRIADFSLSFVHRRLVLLSFDRAQIVSYLRRCLPSPTLEVDGEVLGLRRLAQRLDAGDLPVDATNPFVLWLLCLFLYRRRTWPASRVQLICFFHEENYARKHRDAQAVGLELPPAEEAFRAWARFAFLITERNRGSAVPVEILLEGADPQTKPRILDMIHAGTWCGVLAESFPGAERQVRFEHHRFQEYFTALWIAEKAPSIQWLDKLDAPRWQETMLNLVLMGGAEDGVQALATAIGADVIDLKAGLDTVVEGDHPTQNRISETDVAYRQEARLADRVELGARLTRGAPTSHAVREELRSSLRPALNLLVERGRPVSQVKMMRACHQLDDTDLLGTLDSLLDSPVRWVGNQALILVTAARSGKGLGKIDLASSIGLSLAASDFLPRLGILARAVASAGTRRLQACFALTALFAFIDLAFLVGGAWGVLGFSKILVNYFDHSALRSFDQIPRSSLTMIQVLLVASATLVGFRFFRENLWAWVMGSLPVGLSIIIACIGISRGNIGSLGWVFFGVFFFLLSSPAMAAFFVFTHLTMIILYIPFSRTLIGEDHALSFLRLAWIDSRKAFDSVWSKLRENMRFDSSDWEICLLLLAGLVVLLFYAGSTSLGVPYVRGVDEGVAILIFYGVVLLGFRVLRRA